MEETKHNDARITLNEEHPIKLLKRIVNIEKKLNEIEELIINTIIDKTVSRRGD